jgi:hypothetical protein
VVDIEIDPALAEAMALDLVEIHSTTNINFVELVETVVKMISAKTDHQIARENDSTKQ